MTHVASDLKQKWKELTKGYKAYRESVQHVINSSQWVEITAVRVNQWESKNKQICSPWNQSVYLNKQLDSTKQSEIKNSISVSSFLNGSGMKTHFLLEKLFWRFRIHS